MYYLDADFGHSSRMRNAVLVAIAMHAALLLGVAFKSDSTPYQAPQIEVTLAMQPGRPVPDEARHIAQANQQGGGVEAELEQVTSPNNELSSDGEPGHQALLRPREAPSEPRRETITTAAAAQRAIASEQPEREQLPLLGLSPEVDKLTRELASLEAELDEQSRNYARMPRVRRLTSVAARESVDAAYLMEWRRRVEAVGNKYYPEASVRYGIYGKLRLLVVIRADGSLHDIRVLSSSGYAVLDEAAIKIVRMAAPYAPFPAELRATTDQLEIIRTWQFQENRLSSQ